MNELARWEPFQDSVFDLMPALFRPVVNRAFPGPRMDVIDTGVAYQLAVELPGMEKDAIQVSVYKNAVTINAELAEEKEAKDSGEQPNWLLRERSFGKFSRTITLPDEVDDAGSEAKYADGVLTLTLKKTSASRTKRLTVH